MIVALDHHQYFPLKYYAAGRVPVRLLEPDPHLFWGWHLIRPGDLISPEQLDEALHRGIWVVDKLPDPAILPALAGARPLEQYEFHYYHSLHRRLFVHHYRGGDGPPEDERPVP